MEEQPSTSGSLKRLIPQELQEEIDVIAEKRPRITGKPTDLEDNQKRWLIVGICLHTVISPALRKYIVSILSVLYNDLTRNHMIDTQTYPTHLKQYPPTNTMLNYKAVNNNKATFGNQKAKYDYTIKNVVDLSKLFLQTHMAHYTGFDDTCDSSVLLGLIINIDKFGPDVKSDAEDVRTKIRNPWAHCNFTEWDAVKCSDSFQLMEKLVKDLCLISTEEHQTIGEIKQWEINGRHVLSGTTLDRELVKYICQQTQVLAKHTKLVAIGTDHNSMRIEHIENIDKILNNRLTQLEKDMKTGFLDMNTKLMAKEENQNTLVDSQKGEIEFWKEQEEKFVDTQVVNDFSKLLESEQSVLMVGEPGIGKSMLLHNVALKLQKKIDYNIIPCTGIHDILQHYEKDKRQMFVLDDICGKFTVSMSDIAHWINNEDKLKRILKKGGTKIAAACRLDIYKDAKFQELFTIFESNIFNLSVSYSREDKLTICKKYLSDANIQLLKSKNVNFTPLMCSLYSKNNNFNLIEFLHSPFETYTTEWNKLKGLDSYKYCSLFLLVIYNGIIKESLFEMLNENKSVLKYIFETCGIDRSTSRGRIKTVLDSMIGTYVLKSRSEYRVIHNHMFDFLCCYFGNKDTMVRCFIHVSDIRVFNERTQLQSVNEQYGKFTIMISKEHEKEYFERIVKDIKFGKMNQCFYNTQMKYEVYRTLLLKILESIDEKILMAQLYQRKKPLLNLTYGYDSIETSKYQDYSDDDDEKYLIEGPFIISCLQGYYDIFQYFLSKKVDIEKCYLIHTPLTAACKGGNEQIVQILLKKGCDVHQVDGKNQTPLIAACKRGHEKIVQLLIDKGSKVNQVDGTLLTPLTAACERGNEQIVQLLIYKGCDVNQVDYIGQVPLITACYEGYEKIAQLLISEGSDVDHINNRGQTPLITACYAGNEQLVQLLIEKGSKINIDNGMGQTPLIIACSTGNLSIVQFLIKKGSDIEQVDGFGQTSLTIAIGDGNQELVELLIDEKCVINRADGVRQTPLLAACRKGNKNIVQLLINKGSDVNQVDRIGQTPLTIACDEGNEKIIQLLLDKGSDVNQVSRKWKTPLSAACKRGNEKIVQLLIDKGSDVNQVDGMWLTPLTAACKGENENIVQLLIEKGSNVNQADGKKQTPLTIACKEGNEKIVKLLLENGSDANQVGSMGLTPLITACGEANEKIVQLLLENGSDANQVCSMGLTPLITACGKANEKIVQLLVDKVNNINQVNRNGQTPLTYAIIGGNEKIVQVLIDSGSDVNQIYGKGKTYLTCACQGQNENIVQVLIEKGSDVNKVGDMGLTPLTAACKSGNVKIVQLLIDNGSDVNQVDGLGQTPLTTSCSKNSDGIVQFLRDKGSWVNQADGRGDTHSVLDKESDVDLVNDIGQAGLGFMLKLVQVFIHTGCDANQIDDIQQTSLTAFNEENQKIIQMLIDKGSEVNQIDRKGLTSLTAACMVGNEKIVQLLIDNGSDVNQDAGIEMTPLTAACKIGNIKIIQLLIEKGSDVNKVDGIGLTPLTAVGKGGNDEIVQLLIEKGSDVNQEDDKDKTALTAACSKDNEKIVQLLRDNEIEINHVGGNVERQASDICK